MLHTLGALATAGALAGCSGTDSDATTTTEGDVAVSPDGAFSFDPEEYTVSVGDTVTWYFAASGHNVSAIPEDSDEVSIPDDAEPFASYGEDESMTKTEPADTTYEHTFEVPGTYTYVCIPHVGVGMIGDIVVEE